MRLPNDCTHVRKEKMMTYDDDVTVETVASQMMSSDDVANVDQTNLRTAHMRVVHMRHHGTILRTPHVRSVQMRTRLKSRHKRDSIL
jgi:hypothetical protein